MGPAIANPGGEASGSEFAGEDMAPEGSMPGERLTVDAAGDTLSWRQLAAVSAEKRLEAGRLALHELRSDSDGKLETRL